MAGSCSRCGAPRDDGWAFCRSCGAVEVPAQRRAADAADDAVPSRPRPAAVSAGPEAPVRAADRPRPTSTGGSPAHGFRVPPGRPEGEARPAPRPVPAVSPGTLHAPRVRVPLHDTPGAGVPRGPASVARPAVRVGTLREWAEAALAALTVLAVLAVPGAVLLVALGNEAAGTSPLLLVPVAVALGVGGSVDVFLGPLGGSVAVTPLLITGAAVASGAGLVVSRARPAPDVGVQAARTLMLFVIGLGAVAALGRASAEGGSITVDVPSTLLGGALWFGGALVLAIGWRRPDALPPALRPARDLLAGPVAGLGAVLGACWLGGLALVVAGALARSATLPAVPTTTSAPPVATVLLVVVLVPTALLTAFAVCLGVPLTGRGPFLEGEVGLVHLLGAGPSWWLAPLVAAVVCTLGGMVAALQATDPDDAVRRGWLLGPALAALLALAVPVTGAAVGPFVARLDLATGVVLGLAWGAVGGLLGAVIAPGLPPALRSGRLGPRVTTAGQVVGVVVVVAFLVAALAIGFAAAARVG
ncbi:hypothetical protein WCD74_00585 [Actinomycetospora sp. OC33-EN08]|uniref:Zinc ribbon domain-containing protein n=1 Tax=Actinomycetospora aurantiaca TaxID=3129233 RepID=A0ABU8MFZ0_9PSEU